MGTTSKFGTGNTRPAVLKLFTDMETMTIAGGKRE